MSSIKVGLFGLGTVGEGIVNVIDKARNADAEIKRICVRDSSKPRNVHVPKSMITENRFDVLDDPEINLIVEVINDADAAFEIVSEALKRGISVVSGSKTMIARHLPELIDLQRKHNVSLLYDASSCGSIPVIRNLEEYYDNDLLLEVKGILNGSSNFILSRVFDHNESYEQALQTAIDLGFAEADPSFDIEGYDSLYKLIIITVHALGVYVKPEDIFTYGITNISDFDINYAREKRVKIKLVAQVVKISDSRFTMFVMPEFVTKSRYIYSVDDEYNGVVIRGECYDRQFMFGKGAGSLPTASSILSDMVAHHHGYRYDYKKMGYADVPQYTTDVLLKVYVRFSDTNIPELLPFHSIQERYISQAINYVIGEIKLADLISHREILDRPDVSLINISRFFEDRDQ
ncbi:MAG: homoserine dehydrogenase [Muribaculaceae bacterium]|nr:homoserine dehydrogenase [Muribaculaceae bacterium]